jgi:hypothetical protein
MSDTDASEADRKAIRRTVSLVALTAKLYFSVSGCAKYLFSSHFMQEGSAELEKRRCPCELRTKGYSESLQRLRGGT